jgi:transposase InsO family protein
MLSKKTVFVGRDRLFSLLREEELLINNRRKQIHTTQSKHGFKTYTNLIKDIKIIKPRKILVSDITYIDTTEGFKYLSLITDKGARKIVGFSLSHSLSIEGSIKALKMAIKEIGYTDKVIHHSDRGIQYCSKGYINILKENRIQVSMTEKDHVYENALAERVNGILKNELMLGDRLASYKIAEKMVVEAIRIYNEERLHMALDYKTPEQVYAS